ncbi:putative signal peptide protein [Stappia sp. 22II-S9-Z10]|nr:putative signal peptide protein [Stappia sp. 22II-S9-Z10]
MKALTTAAALALMCAVPIGGASAQTVCKGRAEMVTWLLSAAQGRQQQQVFGLNGAGAVLELYSNGAGRWTAVASMPNGRSCVVDSGEGLTVLKPVIFGEPA